MRKDIHGVQFHHRSYMMRFLLPSSLSLILVVVGLVESASNFWRLRCSSRTGAARMDPIMAPGRASGHLHIIFGSSGFSMNATEHDLRSARCTSCEVTQDRSAYWTPSLMFRYPNGSTTMVRQPGGALVYYLAYGEQPKAFPPGFRMVAGDSLRRNFTGPVPDPPTSEWTPADKSQWLLSQKAVGFNCLHYNQRTDEPSLARHSLPSKDFIDEYCTDGLRLELMFPSCWNGRDVDPPDHRSHLAYPDLVRDGACPDGFRHRLVSLFMETVYDTSSFRGVDGLFLLSNGDPTGCGYHGDFIQGWESPFLQQAIEMCNSPSGEVADCPLFTLQSDTVAAMCNFPVPASLRSEDPFFYPSGLLGNVPIQGGPQPAVPFDRA